MKARLVTIVAHSLAFPPAVCLDLCLCLSGWLVVFWIAFWETVACVAIGSIDLFPIVHLLAMRSSATAPAAVEFGAQNLGRYMTSRVAHIVHSIRGVLSRFFCRENISKARPSVSPSLCSGLR